MDTKVLTKQNLKDWLAYEIKRYDYNHCFLRLIFPISEKDIIVKHQILLRMTEYYHNSNKRCKGAIAKLILNRIQNKYAIHVPINTCAKGLMIMHVGSVLINWHASVGENAVFHINTAIVSNSGDGSAPRIGKNLFMGIGSTIMGNIDLGDYVVVGAGGVVNKSFSEDDITLAGVPCKKISDKGCKEWNK